MIFSKRACNPEIMETDTNIDDLVSKMLTKVPAFIFDNSATLDTTNGVFDANPNTRNIFIKPFLHCIQFAISRFFERLDDENILGLKSLVTAVLK